MRGAQNWILLAAIIAVAAFSVVAVWPSNPDRYLPNFVPWPEGKGINITLPTISGNSLGTTKLERRAMSLGLDLRGGTRLVLAPATDQVLNLDDAIEGARDIIERRVNEFGIAESEVNRLGRDRLAVQLPGISPEEAIDKIGRTAFLQFCVPVLSDLNGDGIGDAGGDVAVVGEGGSVRYQEQTCEPQAILDADGNVTAALSRDPGGSLVVQSGEVQFETWPAQGTTDFLDFDRDTLVWQPAIVGPDDIGADEDQDRQSLIGQSLTGQFLRGNTLVDTQTRPGQALLLFQWTADGSNISEIVTGRLAARNLPLAPFLDGAPILGEDGEIIAPTVQSAIRDQGNITGLTRNEAEDLSKLLNIGAFPVPLEVIQQQSVDATLGETAVRNSVIAGIVALALIMLFMIVYYRLPGLAAAAALLIYTAVVLALFKLIPITLTLSGVAAFILSVGIAVDANILIFERMKEELRVGRNLIVALEDGFNRAWSSIRDSNISTLITCGILYYFGNQFDESSIKGFAVTLAIGVIVSLFSAITVSRTFMRVLVTSRFVNRRLWLFATDVESGAGRTGQPAPAVAGGSGEREGR